MSLYRKILIRRDTDQAWESVNPVLGEGELGLSLTAMDLNVETERLHGLHFLISTKHYMKKCLPSDLRSRPLGNK